jgi:hypothetical protein
MAGNAPIQVPLQAAPPNAVPPGPVFKDAPKPLIDIPNIWLWVGGILAVLGAAVVIYLLVRYWRKRQAIIKIPPPVPPHVRARRALEDALAIIGQPEPFSIKVSGALRVYLEERFQFHAPDRTTEEFLYELQNSNLLTNDQKKSVAAFLESCDLIKFARYEPTETELRGLYDAALRLVNETEPREISPAIGSSAVTGQALPTVVNTPPPVAMPVPTTVEKTPERIHGMEPVASGAPTAPQLPDRKQTGDAQ